MSDPLKYTQWTPEVARDDPSLKTAVANFEPVQRPAGLAAGKWLVEDSLKSYPGVITRLLLVGGKLCGFCATSVSSVFLSQNQRKKLSGRGNFPLVGACLIAWLA